MANNNSDNMIGKGVGMLIAVGALAVGVAAAAMNNERARQLRTTKRAK